ncbi:MAG TPA: tetratricopeptide repeat protein, partial [Planctomycetota bacterium]|nr:tetratricopeptide repeat protein [Planctomycetota bacterium]
SGVFLYSRNLPKEGRQALRASLSNDSEIVDLQWDGYGLVTVHRIAQGGGLTLRVNGKVDASTGAEDMRTQAFLADLPMLHHPAPRKVLVVGLGAGVTAGAATRYDVERVDCVEISPAVASAARHFREVNHGCLENPRLRLRIGDGRQAVRYAREPYDVIICEPSNLWLSGMANLFTHDFFREASRALTDDGVFCQWIHAYRLGSEDFKAILRTFYDVFPGGSVWEILPGGDYLLLGTRRPVALPFDGFRARVEAVAARAPHLRDPFHPPLPGLMSHLVADAATVRAAAGPGDLLTDDRCRVEYTAPFSLYREDRASTLGWLDGVRGGTPESVLYAGATEEDRRPLGARRQSRRAIARAMAIYTAPPPAQTGPGHYDPRGPEALAAMKAAVEQFGEDGEGRRLLESRSLELMRDAGASHKAGHPEVAARYLSAVPSGVRVTLEARLLLGRLLLEARDVAGARRAYEEALSIDGRSYVATTGLASVAGGEGRLDEALRLWAAAAALRPDEAVPWLAQAQIHARTNRAADARAACDEAMKRGKGSPEVKEAVDQILQRTK